MKKDIATRTDIELLMNSFYEKLLADENINYIFIDVARLDIKSHIPVIADFWESVLLNKNVYHNNTMKIHLDLNDKTPLTKTHFDIWLKHFSATVDELFEGNIALLQNNVPNLLRQLCKLKLYKNKT